MKQSDRKSQRGGFAIGLIVGLLVGLALALGVALYVTKAPNPFVNKVPQRAPGQDAAEAERNRNWNPNTPLAGKNPARPASEPAAAPALPPLPEATPASAVAPPAAATRAARASAPATGRETPAGERAPAVPGRPGLSTAPGADPFSYYVQAGAYAHTEDAEQQRAKLAMLGIESRVTEREQSGRTVFRVRVGPFDKKEAADAAKERLNDAGIDSALVRVQK